MTVKDEVRGLLTEHAPDVEFEIADEKGLVDAIPTIVVIVAEAAVVAFPFLWKIFLAWLDRHTNGKVTIRYKGDEDKEIVVEYSKLSKKEVEELVRSAREKAQPALLRIEFARD